MVGWGWTILVRMVQIMVPSLELQNAASSSASVEEDGTIVMMDQIM